MKLHLWKVYRFMYTLNYLVENEEELNLILQSLNSTKNKGA